MTKADKVSTGRKATAVKLKAGKEAKEGNDVQVAKRAARWKPEEVEHLLDMIQEWLPGGPNQWENVALNYNRQLKDPTKFDVAYLSLAIGFVHLLVSLELGVEPPLHGSMFYLVLLVAIHAASLSFSNPCGQCNIEEYTQELGLKLLSQVVHHVHT